MPFTPKGDVAEAEMIFNFLKDKEPGDVVTYAQLDELLGREFKSGRSPFYTANHRLVEEIGTIAKNVPRVGYKIAIPEDVPAMIKLRRKRARRQLKKGQHEATHVDKQNLTEEQLKSVKGDQYVMTNAIIELDNRMREQERKSDDLEERVTALERRSKQSGEVKPPLPSRRQRRRRGKQPD